MSASSDRARRVGFVEGFVYGRIINPLLALHFRQVRAAGARARSQSCDSLWTTRAVDQLLEQAVFFLLIVANALILWKTLCVLTGSESPIVVVLSGSMRPAIDRGDLLFLTLRSTPFRVGDVPVYSLPGRDIPIVHRVLEVHERPTGVADLLTKGDNNTVNDLGLYNRDQWWLQREHIVGRAQGFAKYIGMVTVIMNEHAQVKYVLGGVLLLYVLLNRET